MKHARFVLLSISCLGLALALVALLVGPHRAAQAQDPCDRYVLGIDASDTGDCSDEQHPCRTIQYAIDQAVEGDRICVARHTLAGPLVYPATLQITKSVTLDGAWDAMCVDPSDLTCSFAAIPCDPHNVTIDAIGCGRAISITGHVAPVIDCFTITGGDATNLGGTGPYGYDLGGGLYSRYADTTVSNSIIRGNTGSTSGIAWGGGLGFFGGNPTVRNCRIENNVASTASNGYGGGLYFRNVSATVENSIVQDNVASMISDGRGGGVAAHFSDVWMDGSILRRNVANDDDTRYGYGGGMYLYHSDGPGLTNNIVADNRLRGSGKGCGLYLDGGDIRLLHTTLAENAGGDGQGVYALTGATVHMTNTIVASHTVGVEASGVGTLIELEATLWWDTDTWVVATTGGTVFPKPPDVNETPGFVNAGCGDYHIGLGSAAINAGIEAGVSRDIDGEPRPVGSAPDLGADEYVQWVYLPLVLR